MADGSGEDWSVERTKRLTTGAHGSVTFPRASVLALSSEVEPRVARRWLPGLLKPSDPARATFFFAHYPETSFGLHYREVGLLLHARFLGKPVLFCAWMVVDDDSALILGRELLGFPKKLAAIDLCNDARGARGAVRRRGVDLLSFDARTTGAAGLLAPFPAPIANIRGVPGLLPPALWLFSIEQRVLEARTIEGEVRIGRSEFDPLEQLGFSSLPAKGLVAEVDLSFLTRRRWPVPKRCYPIGLISPLWLIGAFPFRSL